MENWQACEKQEKSFNFKYSRIQGILLNPRSIKIDEIYFCKYNTPKAD